MPGDIQTASFHLLRFPAPLPGDPSYIRPATCYLPTVVTDHLALNPGKRISAEIRRLACDLTDRGLEHIRSFEAAPDIAVHETRKRLKELRALLRIVRGGIGERGYRFENRHLRDTGRLLSPARDAAVLLETLEILRAHPEAAHIAEELEELAERLAPAYQAEMERLKAHNVPQQVEESLNALMRRVMTWPIRREGFAVLESGLLRVYRNAADAMERSAEKPTDEHLHEWRKQTKHFWYQVRMLAPAWPSVLNGLAETLHDLSDVLGRDHDLAVFSEACRRHELPGRRIPLLPTLIRRRREEIRKNLWIAGARPFAEEPEAFAGRMEAYWKAAVRER